MNIEVKYIPSIERVQVQGAKEKPVSLLKRIRQIFCWHDWSHTRGYDQPVPGAICTKCGKPYKE